MDKYTRSSVRSLRRMSAPRKCHSITSCDIQRRGCARPAALQQLAPIVLHMTTSINVAHQQHLKSQSSPLCKAGGARAYVCVEASEALMLSTGAN